MVYVTDVGREPAYQERVAWPKYAAVADDPLAHRWLSLLDARGRDEKTLDAYGRAVNDFLLFLRVLGVAVREATEEHVARYVQDMHGRGPRRPGVVPPKALKNATMRQRLTAVRSLYDDLFRRELVAEHPCPRGVLGRAGRGSVRGMLPRERTVPWIPDEEEWAQFLEAARPEPLRNRVMILFAYEGALRRETLVGLELGDVDVSNRLVCLRPETMKGGRPGVVVTFSETTARAYVPYLHELKAQAGRSQASTKRVFRTCRTGTTGTP